MLIIDQIVKVRKDLEAGKLYGKNKILFNEEMECYKNKNIIIQSMNYYDNDQQPCYHIVDDNGWFWVEEMFEVGDINGIYRRPSS